MDLKNFYAFIFTFYVERALPPRDLVLLAPTTGNKKPQPKLGFQLYSGVSYSAGARAFNRLWYV